MRFPIFAPRTRLLRATKPEFQALGSRHAAGRIGRHSFNGAELLELRNAGLALAGFAFAVLAQACGGNSDSDKIEVEKPNRSNSLEHEFHSADNPGPWKHLSFNHDPVVSYDKPKRVLKVASGYEGDGGHYTEWLAFYDVDWKEVARADVKRGAKTAELEWKLPDAEKRAKFTAAFKCNLHDMWMEKVDLKKIAK